MLHTIEIYFLLFMSYSVLGWTMEVTCKFFEYKRFINRGFLIGPYCPIYGWGAIAITILLQKYLEDPLVLFVFGILLCSILEYFTSFFMEKVFHARWWDYSRRKFNINGRICLNTMIPFGILGMIISYVSNPFLFGIFSKLSDTAINVVCSILLSIYLIDNLISTKVISGVSIEGRKLEKDNTEEITEKVKEILMKRSWAYKRLLNAYPGLKEIGDVIKENAERVKAVTQANIEKAMQATQVNIDKAKEGIEKVKEVSEKNIRNVKNIGSQSYKRLVEGKNKKI